MRRLVSLSMAAALLGCVGYEESVDRIRRPIVGGELETGSPAVAALISVFPNSSSICTATLVADDVLLTAAHCLNGERAPNELYAYFGTNVLDEDDPDFLAQIDVAEIAYDARFLEDEPFLGHDIAVARLTEAAPASPVSIDTRSLESLYGDPIRMVGFGQIESGSGAGVKRDATATIHDPVDLIDVDLSNVVLYGDSTATVCLGDSGGPGLVTTNSGEAIAAVASFTTSDCTGFSGGTPAAQFVTELVEPFLDRGAAAFCAADGICGSSCADDPDCNGEVCVSDGNCYEPCGASDADCPVSGGDEPSTGDDGTTSEPDGDGSQDGGSEDGAGSTTSGGCSSAESSHRPTGLAGLILVLVALGVRRRRVVPS